ncbi:hypothetical protein EAF04_000731 [Stromatinia cepivora]|nr:hypothetical protein EAF04_000731 [Stromatinia cepivora]
MKTILFPTSIWGLFNALSGPHLTTNDNPLTTDILCRFPITLIWVWLALLPFNINNQRLPDAIEEDSINKPWRPLVSGRLSPLQATFLMYAIFILDFLVSFLMHAFIPCLIMFILGYIYNDLGGADSAITRNFINALGFQAFGWGATMVASNSVKYGLSQAATLWFPLIGLVVFTTVQSQDMYDQEGDRLRGRQTLPLVIGDGPARWVIAIGVTVWSVYCPQFWGLSLLGKGSFMVTILGVVVVYRTLLKRTVEEDKLTFKIWCFWTLSLYILPYVRRLSTSGGTWN